MMADDSLYSLLREAEGKTFRFAFVDGEERRQAGGYIKPAPQLRLDAVPAEPR
jgi:hypothetical protein